MACDDVEHPTFCCARRRQSPKNCTAHRDCRPGDLGAINHGTIGSGFRWCSVGEDWVDIPRVTQMLRTLFHLIDDLLEYTRLIVGIREINRMT